MGNGSRHVYHKSTVPHSQYPGTSPQTDLSVLILSLMSSSLLYINRDKWSLKLRLSSEKTSFIFRNAKLKLMAYCFLFLLTFG